MSCEICPRKCNVDRTAAIGFCGCSSVPKIARAALHFDEEPCISGTRGSGAIFFSGCNMKCIYCQNIVLQSGHLGEFFPLSLLSDCMLKLQDLGAHNINLVTPTPHMNTIVGSIRKARQDGLHIPILYNTNSYEMPSTIQSYDKLVEIFLPDLKYHDDRLAIRFSNAPHYSETALKAIEQMILQTGFMKNDADGIAVSGVRIRHLVLPGCVYDTRMVLKDIASHFGTDCPISLMSQYTPISTCKDRILNRRITAREYETAVDYCISLGFRNVYTQGLDSVGTSYTPSFSNHVDI